MNVDGCRIRGRPKKIWTDCMRNDMCIKNVNTEMTADTVEWKNILCCAHIGGIRVKEQGKDTRKN